MEPIKKYDPWNGAENEGLLQRQQNGVLRKTWEEKWFVLMRTKLFQFSHRTDRLRGAAPAETIDLLDFNIKIVDKASKKKWLIQLTPKGKAGNILLRCASASERDQWFKSLSNAQNIPNIPSSTADNTPTTFQSASTASSPMSISLVAESQPALNAVPPAAGVMSRQPRLTMKLESLDDCIRYLRQSPDNSSMFEQRLVFGAMRYVDRRTDHQVHLERLNISDTNLNVLIPKLRHNDEVQHDNIAIIMETFATSTSPPFAWIVRERPAFTLSEIILEYALIQMDEGQIARIVLEILKALDFLHSQSREHGSIGTSEVCIFGDGAIKLLTAGGPSAAPTETPFCCLAPEKIRMTESGMHSDIWSVGMLVREMMEGEIPYADSPPLRAAFLVITKGIPPLSEISKWSPEILDFLAKCLTSDKEQRPSTKMLLEHPFLITKACDASNISSLVSQIVYIKSAKKISTGE